MEPKYCILTDEQLDSILPVELKMFKSYNLDQDYILRDVIFGVVQPIKDSSTYLCYAILRDAEYISNNCIKNYPTDYSLWVQYISPVINDITNIELNEEYI